MNSVLRWESYPLLRESSQGHTRLTIQANLGLAPSTIEAYGRALEDYFAFSACVATCPLSAKRDHIALYVHDLASRPHPRGRKILTLDSGAGLANATMQQRLTAVRLFYDYLVEEGVRETNPVGRGRYTPGKGFGGQRDRGLLPRYRKLPWLPGEEQWARILEAARQEILRNQSVR